jgi:DNA-binding response OmpR family regulator
MSTVLLSEGDPDIRHLVSSELLRSGFDVLETEGDDETLAAIRRAHPDLVLLDLRRPRLEGLEVLRELRADPGTARLPVIVLTARPGPLDVELSHAAGATDYLVKPFSPGELVRRIEDALTRVGGR